MSLLLRARISTLLTIIMGLVLLAAMALPAAAKSDNAHGRKAKADRAATTEVTEDNDTNDNDTPNNVVDDGDNRHPSGKDKSVEHGNSGNQGRSTSDPDDDGRGPDRSNGGADKPDGPGGVDLADQDGNNGCGNDDDFEDDNEGWCGKPPRPAPAPGGGVAPVEEEPTCTPGTAGCPDEEPSCTPGTAGCPDEEPSCTPGSAGCPDEEPTCTPGTAGCPDEEPTCTPGTAGCPTEVVPGEDTDVDGTTDSPDVDDEDGDVLGVDEVAEGDVEGETGVQGVAIERTLTGSPRLVGSDAAAPAAVEATSLGRSLAQTGLGLPLLALLGMSGLGAGAGLLRKARRR